MASRDEKKARTAIEELKEQTGKEAIYLELNLASLASVRKSAAEFLGYVGSYRVPVSPVYSRLAVKRRNCMFCITMRECMFRACDRPGSDNDP